MSTSIRLGPILVADENDGIRAAYRTTFAPTSRRIIEATDGREALTAALVWTPALIVTELALPHIDGLSLCDIVRTDRATRDIPIVVVTASDAPDRLGDPRVASAAAVFVKPVAADDLYRTVHRLLADRSDRVNGGGRQQAPPARCPRCDRPMLHDSSHVGGRGRNEQWDYFRCLPCSCTFQYRHRTRTLRRTQ